MRGLDLSLFKAVYVNKDGVYTFKTTVFLCFWLSDLLNFNGPYRGRLLLGNREGSRDHSVDEEDNTHDEERAAMAHCSSCMEEHLVERLSPTLHKGTYGTKQQI